MSIDGELCYFYTSQCYNQLQAFTVYRDLQTDDHFKFCGQI